MLTRRSLAAVALAASTFGPLACAKVEPPPGGPPDTAPPQITAVRPESGSVVPQLRDEAEIRFDEVIDEMASGTPGAGLERFVLLSPVAGRVRVSWARTAIRVRPREGWRQGRVYRLELRPGLLDLRRNILKEGRVILFSTGPAIPRAELSGTVVQWVEQRTAPEALIQAALLPDTAAYVTFADSGGQFRLAGVPPGRYALYAVVDQNKNGVRDRRESYDSTIVTLDSMTSTVLWTFVHDTTGPRLRTADPVDSLSVRLVFSQALDPAARFETSHVRVLALPDSTPVAVSAVLTPAAFDSLLARARAADSAQRAAADTTPPPATPRPDTAAQPPPPTRRAPPPGRPAFPQPGLIRGAAPPPTAEGDTAAFRALLRQRPAPADRVVLRMVTPLAPGAKYVVRVRGARNLNGATADGQAIISVPVPRPAARDSTRRP